VEERRRLVNEKTKHSNWLTSTLKLYFPQMVAWIDDVDSKVSCALLQTWPALKPLQAAAPATLKKFFLEHRCRSQQRIQEYLDGIRQAQEAVNDSALLETCPVVMQGTVAVLETLRQRIAVLDKLIEQQFAAHEDAPLFANLPGAGPVMKPRLLVAFGTNRERWRDANALQSFSGIAPVTQSSGNSISVHRRFACPSFVRQTFHEFAAHSISRSAWAKAYYERQTGKGKKHHAVVRALAFKWIRILFRCWKDRTPYDEARYLQSLEKHGSPLATLTEWQAVGGSENISKKKD